MNNTEVYYIKNSNGEFEPVRAYDVVFDSLPIGSHLITIDKNGTSWTYHVDPDFIALRAAAEAIKNRLAAVVMKSIQLRANHSESLTEHQEKLMEELKESGINSAFWPSAHEIADNLLAILIEKSKAASQVPWVAELEEQYRAAVALTLNEKNEQ